MRAFECKIPDNLRSDFIEVLLQRGEKLSISRKRDADEVIEEWMSGKDWFQLIKTEKEGIWVMRFGSRAFGKDYIEDTIEWISSKEGVVWIWPREGVDEWCNQTGESNSE